MATVINYDISAYPILSAFLQDKDHSVVGIRGPFGSGKSVGCCFKILKSAMEMPRDSDGIRRSKWVVVRNTAPQLRDTTIQTWLRWVPEDKFGPFLRQAREHHIKFDDVELTVLFRALDDDNDVRNILSLEVTGAWLNEAREIPWVIPKNLRGRLKRFPVRHSIPIDRWLIKPDKNDPEGKWSGEPYLSQIIMDTNSPDSEHWWYKFAEVDTPEGFKFYAQPSGLSPLAENRFNLSPSYYREMMQGADEEWIKVHVMNEYGFIIDGKAVYPEYRDMVHCVNDLNPIQGLPITRGWDFGLTPACIFLQVDPKGRVLVFDELVAEDMGVERFSDLVVQHSLTKYGGFKFQDYGDPAGMQKAQTDERTCFQILHTKNIMIEGGKQDPTIRIESVKKALNTMVEGRPGFLLHSRCKQLRKGFFGAYQYRKLKVSGFAKYSDKPDKNSFSHPHDALQYPLTVLYGGSLTDPYFNVSEEEMEEYYNEETVSGRDRLTGY